MIAGKYFSLGGDTKTPKRGLHEMPKTTDESWAAFQSAVKDIAPKDLADKLGLPDVDKVITSSWKQGKRRPKLSQLPAISTALGKDESYLATRMGMIPDSSEKGAQLVRLQERLVVLRERVGTLQKQLEHYEADAADRRNAAVGDVVAKAALTGKWAVSVYPANEGPADHLFHVCDRLDFTRVDNGPVDKGALRSEPEIVRALDNAHAVYSPSSRPRWHDWMREDAPPVLSYSIPRLTSMFPPGSVTPIKDLPSVAVVALTVQSWVMDIAGFLARFLNYGLLTTRGICSETYGGSVVAEWKEEDDKARRREIHTALLANPQARYVWGHFALRDAPRALFPDESNWPEKLTCVWIRESDEVLRQTAMPGSFALYKRARDLTTAYVNEQRTQRIIVIDIDWPQDERGERLSGEMSRHARMEQNVVKTVEIVREMRARGYIDEQTIRSKFDELNGPNRYPIAKTLHRWLENTGRLLDDQ
jgi:transcriptional regulator with XRE-family HTH domain